MPRTPRHELFDEDNVGIYHCINRCVRRAFLCGLDPLSGKSFDHRKDWIRDRLEELAGIFAIDVIGYSVLSGHFHVILRNRPDLVTEWSNDQVARRWWNLFPQRRDDRGRPAEPEEHELRAIVSDRKKMKELRRRLSHISWFMRCLAENIAVRANREDETSGRFWAGRFRAIRILDETALLAVAIYVDLNPIRAGIAKTPETSRYTSAYDRIRTRQQAKQARISRKGKRGRSAAWSARPDGWLSPVPLECDEEPESAGRQRASNSGFLSMSLDEYLQLLDWTGRQVRGDKRGSIPSDLAPILERLQIVPETWIDAVVNFGRCFRSAAGRAESLVTEAARRGRRWLHGTSYSRTTFA